MKMPDDYKLVPIDKEHPLRAMKLCVQVDKKWVVVCVVEHIDMVIGRGGFERFHGCVDIPVTWKVEE